MIGCKRALVIDKKQAATIWYAYHAKYTSGFRVGLPSYSTEKLASYTVSQYTLIVISAKVRNLTLKV